MRLRWRSLQAQLVLRLAAIFALAAGLAVLAVIYEGAQSATKSGRPVSHDCRTYGRLVVRGGTVPASYSRRDDQEIVDDAGYFETGGLATIDDCGHIPIAG